jgi:hypothetical protein
MARFYLGAAALCVLGMVASQAGALTYNFAGGTAEVTQVAVAADLTPHKGDSVLGAASNSSDAKFEQLINDDVTGTTYDMYARQQANGASEIAYYGDFTDTFNARPNAVFTALTTINSRVTNTGSAASIFRFDYQLSGMFIDTIGGGFETGKPAALNFAGAPTGALAGAISHNVSVDGVVESARYMQFWVNYGPNGPDLTGSEHQGMAPNIYQTPFGYRADVGDITATVDLGVLNAGSSKTVSVTMGAVAVHTGEAEIHLGISDPNSFGGGGNFSASAVMAPVPVPASVWLLLGGVAALGWRRRRDKSRPT